MSSSRSVSLSKVSYLDTSQGSRATPAHPSQLRERLSPVAAAQTNDLVPRTPGRAPSERAPSLGTWWHHKLYICDVTSANFSLVLRLFKLLETSVGFRSEVRLLATTAGCSYSSHVIRKSYGMPGGVHHPGSRAWRAMAATQEA